MTLTHLVLFEVATLGDHVALVEAEALVEHAILEPDLSTRLQEDLVEVVSDTTPVLYLSYHVAHCPPRYACIVVLDLRTILI